MEYESHILGANTDLGKWLTARAAAGWRPHSILAVPANRRLDDPRGPGVELSLLVVLERRGADYGPSPLYGAYSAMKIGDAIAAALEGRALAAGDELAAVRAELAGLAEPEQKTLGVLSRDPDVIIKRTCVECRLLPESEWCRWHTLKRRERALVAGEDTA